MFRKPLPGTMNRTSQNTHSAEGIISACSDCGNDVVHPYLKELQAAQMRIAELEEHINTLTLRATTAMEKATEYETSLQRMNSLSSAGRSSTPEPSSPPTQNAPSQIVASPERSTSRGAFSRLLPARMPSLRSATASPSLAAASPQITAGSPSLAESIPNLERPKQFPMLAHTPPTPSIASDLQARLDKESELRKAAEAEAEKTKSEIEELTATLFGQANKLVADERRARDKLEKRVEVLERRDQEKTKRLGLLDVRVQRIERVRQVLSEKIVLIPNKKQEEEEDEDRWYQQVRQVSVKA